jgi:hypothetical protein
MRKDLLYGYTRPDMTPKRGAFSSATLHNSLKLSLPALGEGDPHLSGHVFRVVAWQAGARLLIGEQFGKV